MSGGLKSREELEKAIKKINEEVQFKDAHLELSSERRMDDLLNFHKVHFHPDEVLAKSIGFNIDEEFKPIMSKLFSEHLSLLLISDTTNEIIACRTILIGKRDEQTNLLQIPNEKIKTIMEFIRHKNKEMDVYKRFNCDTSVEFLSLGTHRDHRKQGIASKMFQAALQFCKKLGLDPVYIKGEGTSNFSHRIYEKFGFETLHTIRYEDYKVDGQVVFKDTGDHKTMKIYVKKIEPDA